MPVSRLTYKYQATIPKVVREALALAAGDRVEFLLDSAGGVRLRRAPEADPELQALEATLAPEWDSAADEDAYAEL
jgi:AbrB family looped-hinge helix DNA binding protein